MQSRLAAIDLNLLLVLEALMIERNVTSAARRLGLSQSAASHALARLRETLDDPLFTRTSRGMTPTAEANRLFGPVREALEQLRGALSDRTPFDPASASGLVRICAADLGHTFVIPELCARLSARAPRVALSTMGFLEDTFQMLADGRADVALGLASLGPDLHQRPLDSQPFLCVVRREHPQLEGGRLSLEDYVSLKHALVSPRGLPRGYVDRALAERGLSREVALVAPHLLPAALAVASSDLVLTVPARMAVVAASLLPLKVFEPPVPVEPFSLTMSWHDRRDNDPLHAWVREEIVSIVSAPLEEGSRAATDL